MEPARARIRASVLGQEGVLAALLYITVQATVTINPTGIELHNYYLSTPLTCLFICGYS